MGCPQCKGITAKGQQCRLKTCKFAPKCHMHTPVTIAKSTIPNLGNWMIAKKDIKKGEILADYTIGTKKMTPSEFRAAYPNGRATHVWAPKNESVYYDAKNAAKSVAGAANTARQTGKRNNAVINNNGKMVAKMPIKKGSEVFVPYGSGFKL